jgi:hypothetical protein
MGKPKQHSLLQLLNKAKIDGYQRAELIDALSNLEANVIDKSIALMLAMTEEELNDIRRSDKTPASMKAVAMTILSCMRVGDFAVLSKIIDRVIGTPISKPQVADNAQAEQLNDTINKLFNNDNP